MTNTTHTGWAQLAFMSAGGLIWALHFVTIYSFAALACAKGWVEPGAGLMEMQQPGGVFLLVVAATALALLANIAVIAIGFRRARGGAHQASGTQSFIPYAAAGIALLSILAIIWESFVFMLPVCS